MGNTEFFCLFLSIDADQVAAMLPMRLLAASTVERKSPYENHAQE